MNKFSIDESPNIVVNLTFNTTVLTDGSGGEERNSNWQSPLLNFDLQKVILHKPQLDEIVQFFQAARGAALSFRYRDWSDYLVTAQVRDTKYGSSTQGVLLPNADGVRTEFELVKRYIVPSCTHYRAIAFPDPATVTIYNANFIPFADTDWIFADGKFIFTNPPPAGELFCEGEFDLPVVFASDENQYRIKSGKGGNTYSIEGLQLNEVRGQRSEVRSGYALTDELAEIDIAFALSGHFNSLVGLREQTEIITLASGFDKRTSRFPKPKGTYFLGKIPLHHDELEYLIAFFRCTKGKGLSWGFEDISYQQKLIAVRFDEDNLSLRLNHRGRYETDGLKAIEVFEPLPAALIDPFAVSSAEYLKFFSAPPSGSNPAPPTPVINGYPAPPFYLLDLPYLSVFINSDTPKKLVSTYNGVQRIIGDISYFDSLGAVNLNYRGNGKFYGTALSTDKTKFIIFTDSGISTVKNLDPTDRNLKLSGNVAWDNKSYFFNFSLSTPPALPPQLASLNGNRIDSSVALFSSPNVSFLGNPTTHQIAPSSPRSTFSYSQTLNTIGANPGGFTKVDISWDSGATGGTFTPVDRNSIGNGQSKTESANLSHIDGYEVEHTWDGQHQILTAASDNNSRSTQFIRKGRTLRNRKINGDFFYSQTLTKNQNGIVNGSHSLSGSLSLTDTLEQDFTSVELRPVVVSDHKTVYAEQHFKLTSLDKYEGAVTANNVSLTSLIPDILRRRDELSTEAKYVYVTSIFNLGDLGIYLVSRTEQTKRIQGTEEPFFKGASWSIQSNYVFVGFSVFNPSIKDETTTEEIAVDESIYRIAYLSQDRAAKPGYAGNCTFAQNQQIHDFYLNSGGLSNLTVSLATPYRRKLNRILTEVIRKTNFGTPSDTVSVNDSYEPLDNSDSRNVDLTGQLIIVKQAFAGNIYLALCRINTVTSTPSGIANVQTVANSVVGDYLTVTQLNCEIINVQKIKSFFTTSSFLFTVNGCGVFGFLDPYRTNLIKDKGKVYLAATMPTISEYNTQTLVWQLVSDGLEFYGVFGGKVDSIPVSPGADKWVKYY